MSIFSNLASAVTPAVTQPFSLSGGSPASNTPSGSSFGNTLMGALSDVNDLQLKAGAMAQDFALGKTSDIHSVMIASEQASLALEMTTQIRNKAVDAYQQIMQITM